MNGKNIWYNVVTENFTKNATRPGANDAEKWEWRPAYNRNRVKANGEYTPYKNDGSEWVEMANAALAKDSQNNWINK